MGRERKLNPPFSLGKQTGTKSKTLKYKAKNMSKHFYCLGIIKIFSKHGRKPRIFNYIETKFNSKKISMTKATYEVKC